jgi:energy-coupling factor transporter ATP-binding protein EcfA2
MASLGPTAPAALAQVNICVAGTNNCPSFEGALPRVTVILGSNGAGKSKLLSGIRLNLSQLTGAQNILSFAPANQVGQPTLQSTTLAQAIQEDRQFRDRNYPAKPLGAGELSQTLNLLKLQYESDRYKWDKEYKLLDPKTTERPQLPNNQFDDALDFYKQLIGIELQWNPSDRIIRAACSITGKQYDATELSGGEAWALKIIPDFILRKNDLVTVFVDEPESYFNEALTLSFWSGIEAARPNWRFIYATHRVNFATRKDVEKVILVKGKNKPARELSDTNEISIEDYKAIMGYAPRVAKSERTLFVEGEPGSPDERFYSAVLNDSSVLIMPVGDCNQVVKAVSGQDTIRHVVREGITVKGIVDRDYSSDSKLRAMQAEGIESLDLHEWEAYLCIPVVMAAIAKRLLSKMQDPKTYSDIIVEWAKTQKMKTIAQHFNELGSVYLT